MTIADGVLDARRFRSDYAAHRLAEGRAHSAEDMNRLPYLKTGPIARQWRVRARSFDALCRTVLAPLRALKGSPLSILDVGAGCSWLCYRASLSGDTAVALDIRDDSVDGLGAAAHYLVEQPGRFGRVVGSFDALPLGQRRFDVAIFNASIHYAFNLATVLREAARVVSVGGRIVVLDSPFYASEAAGAAMVAEKRSEARTRFGERASTLMAPPFIEFLTSERLATAASGLGLDWRRHRVRYPIWYETRPLVALVRGRRQPSRFDLWESTVR
jgi:SAM-dependent methyltransferase